MEDSQSSESLAKVVIEKLLLGLMEKEGRMAQLEGGRGKMAKLVSKVSSLKGVFLCVVSMMVLGY